MLHSSRLCDEWVQVRLRVYPIPMTITLDMGISASNAFLAERQVITERAKMIVVADTAAGARLKPCTSARRGISRCILVGHGSLCVELNRN